MAEFPASPIAPSEYFETWLPQAFADAGAPPDAKDVDVKLGVRLDGDGGGEWVMHLDKGSLHVSAGPRTDAAFSIVQSVADWRGCLWEGRGGAFGAQASALFKPGAQAQGPGGQGAPSAAALQQLQALNGLIKMVVKGAEGGDWSVGFRLGPGDVPAEPTTTVTIADADAQAMAAGTLDPMQAFMSGKIQVAGDMALMMQMQMITMQAAQAGGAR